MAETTNNAEPRTGTGDFSKLSLDLVTTSERCAMLLQDLSLHGGPIHGTEAREQNARFNVWVANMGIYSAGQRSLGFRLKDTPETTDLIRKLLMSLEKEIDQIREQLDDAEVQQTEQSSDSQSEAEPKQDENASESSNSSYRLLASDDNDVQAPAQSTLWTSVHSTITTLHQLALTIHEAGLHHRQGRIERFKKQDGNKEIYKTFKRCAKQKVDHLFPKASTLLRKRMAKSIAARRIRFLYINRHQQKISALATSSSLEKKPAAKQGDPAPIPQPARSDLAGMGIPKSKVQPSIVFSNTEITKPDLKRIQDFRGKKPESVASVHVPTAELPHRPKLDPTRTFFTCPYCYLVHPASEAMDAQWRQHLIRDFEPFFCVFDGCGTPFSCTESYTAWIRHSLEQHSKAQWRCWYCGSLDIGSTYYSTAQDLEKHVIDYHPRDDIQSTLPTFMEHSMLRNPQVLEYCPFCGGLPEELERAYPDQKDRRAYKALEEHIKDHLISLALIMFPIDMGNSDNDSGDEKSETNSTIHSVSDAERSLSDLPLTGHRDPCDCRDWEKDSSTDWSSLKATVESKNQLSRDLLPTTHDDPGYVPSGNYRSEWEFWYPLSLPPHCSRVGPPEYPGNSQDGKLRTYFCISSDSPIPNMTDTKPLSAAASPRSRDDYTIGWISALSVEVTAASVMLDEEHAQIPVAAGDNNAYTLGRIGLHHIVIALINEAGGLPARVVAANMMKSFRNIRYVLMVGIGDGIPSDEYQIRLGDVVVSKPKGRSPGVVKSDFAKWEEDGFKVEGALNLPAAGLMRVVGKVETQSLLGEFQEGDIHTSVKHLRRGAFSNMAPWKYQGREHDPLYKEDSDPREDGVCDQCEAQPDLHCPDPKVHYGIIASGNYVVKSRSQRDRLRKDLGACCVEMEAFGLTNHFPCLVIRGISNYADGEKNDKWQPYSALTAVAYAKRLLLQFSVEQIQTTSSLSEQMAHVELFEWLSSLTPWTTHENISRSRVEGTSRSLQEQFSDWISDKPESLILVGLGRPGAGKTVAMSVLIDHIHRLIKESKPLSRAGLAYVYLEFPNHAQQTRESIIGTITRQLLHDSPGIPNLVRAMWENYRPREAPIDEHIKMLCEVCKTFTVAYICIDALDECDNLFDLLKTLKKAIEAVPSIRLICTGRPTIKTSIENMNVRSTLMSIKACDDDVRALIERRIEECEDTIGFDEQKEITDTLLKKCDNIFLLPVLHIRLVLEQPHAKARRDALDSVQPSLEGTYEQTLKRIEGSGKRHSDTAKLVYTWVSLAKRPLTSEELSHALAIKKDENNLDPDC